MTRMQRKIRRDSILRYVVLALLVIGLAVMTR